MALGDKSRSCAAAVNAPIRPAALNARYRESGAFFNNVICESHSTVDTFFAFVGSGQG